MDRTCYLCSDLVVYNRRRRIINGELRVLCNADGTRAGRIFGWDDKNCPLPANLSLCSVWYNDAARAWDQARCIICHRLTNDNEAEVLACENEDCYRVVCTGCHQGGDFHCPYHGVDVPQRSAEALSDDETMMEDGDPEKEVAAEIPSEDCSEIAIDTAADVVPGTLAQGEVTTPHSSSPKGVSGRCDIAEVRHAEAVPGGTYQPKENSHAATVPSSLSSYSAQTETAERLLTSPAFGQTLFSASSLEEFCQQNQERQATSHKDGPVSSATILSPSNNSTQEATTTLYRTSSLEWWQWQQEEQQQQEQQHDVGSYLDDMDESDPLLKLYEQLLEEEQPQQYCSMGGNQLFVQENAETGQAGHWDGNGVPGLNGNVGDPPRFNSFEQIQDESYLFWGDVL